MPPREHVLHTRPRYDEVDQMGVVHHRNYIAYFEMGRTEFMRAAGIPYAELERRGYRFVVTELGATYRAGAAYDQELRVRTRVSRIRPASVRFEYAVSDFEGRVLAEGFTVLACLGARLRPARIPQDVVRALDPARNPAHPPSSFV